MGKAVEVHQIPEGSLVLLRGFDIPDEHYEEFMDNLAGALGHRNFALLTVEGPRGRVRILSDPDDFPEWLAAKIVEEQEDRLARHVAQAPKHKPLRLGASEVRR